MKIYKQRQNALHRAIWELEDDLKKWGFKLAPDMRLCITPSGKKFYFTEGLPRRECVAVLRREIRPYEEAEKAQKLKEQEEYQNSLPTLL